MIRFRLNSSLCSLAVLAASAPVSLCLALPAQAQEVVQALPNPATETLNDALRRLSRSPTNVPALVTAGMASLDLDDVEGASGFFTRAQAVAPDDGRVLVGLALVAVRQGEPIEALEMFEAGEAAGVSLEPWEAERALAFDLVGRNDRAQRLYRQALTREETPEVIRRLALSYAIAGDPAASEAILLPLLQRQDRAAYRTRAFALAIQGRPSEAIAIAETMLPPRLSQRLAPYLRYMPRLTRAQQATAANLGRFPPTAEMGHDTPAIAAMAQGEGAITARPPSAAERLQPQGAPLGRNTGQQVAVAPTPAPAPAPAPSPAPSPAPAPAPAPEDPKSVVEGKRVALGGRRIIEKESDCRQRAGILGECQHGLGLCVFVVH
ncbi:MAG: tetratricopeptide repeat protein, partial [Erythrobacter sp.]|nr:tetratricopeptide repeat protein [Erythrobacter sp.]